VFDYFIHSLYTVILHTHTHTHTEYVIIIALPQQQWLRERAAILRYTHTVCHVKL